MPHSEVTCRASHGKPGSESDVVLPTFRPPIVRVRIGEWGKYAGFIQESQVLRFATIDGQRALPFSKGRGVCSCCGGVLIAKCGKIVTHHWAHESKDDCDSWSEPIGPWHLWWQGMVRTDSIEIARGPHRADIVGNDGVVVELQHSSISAEDIAAREAFYGNMVWLFDATERFAYVNQGDRAFFSFGKTKHLELCKKPVFLDFGFDVLEVEQFSGAVTMLSGFGIARSREWFAKRFLSDCLLPGNRAAEFYIPKGGGTDPWSGKNPVWKLKHETRWIDSATGKAVTLPKWTEYIKLNYYSYKVGDSANKRFDYDKVIERHPEIANGWVPESLRQMKELLAGTPIILAGRLRVLPLPATSIPVNSTVSAMRHLLELAEGHIQAGRIPVLQDTTKTKLLERASEYERRRYGGTAPPAPSKQDSSSQLSLFD